MSSERRDTLRIPDSRLITEFVFNQPNAASVVNLSSTGIYTVKPSTDRRLRGPRRIQLEIPLPEASESVWVLGEIVFERVGMSCMGAGIRFARMADFHQRLIDELVETRRQQMIGQMLSAAKQYKDLTYFPQPFGQPPVVYKDNTVKMFFLPDGEIEL